MKSPSADELYSIECKFEKVCTNSEVIDTHQRKLADGTTA